MKKIIKIITIYNFKKRPNSFAMCSLYSVFKLYIPGRALQIWQTPYPTSTAVSWKLSQLFPSVEEITMAGQQMHVIINKSAKFLLFPKQNFFSSKSQFLLFSFNSLLYLSKEQNFCIMKNENWKMKNEELSYEESSKIIITDICLWRK